MTDEELMQAVCDGDQSAYQMLVKQHLKAISHYAFRLLGNRRDTEDVTQEVFLRLWLNAHKWQPEKAKLTTWLHRIAHNLCIDYLRKHGNTVVDEEVLDSAVQQSVQQEAQAEQNSATEANERARLLNTAIGTLPENQRSALMLCHYAGFSNKEAAVIMNVSVKALESTIARARRNLKSKLERDEILRGETESIGS